MKNEAEFVEDYLDTLSHLERFYCWIYEGHVEDLTLNKRLNMSL